MKLVGYQEEQSSALLQKTLADAGFRVQHGVAEMPTGFTATYGSGKPVLVIVGEFDALPGLSQAPGNPARQPLNEGAPCHGCGHNLLGTASAAAAMAVKDWMIQTKQSGTLRYYGTPAEEGGGGKVYTVRAGLLKDVDAVIGWHPGDTNAVTAGTTLATITASFKFRGIAAHAAAAPDKGRSALDAVEAMDYMANMMREHVLQETRIHYVIRKGGVASNIVPDNAEVSIRRVIPTCACSTASGIASSTRRKARRSGAARQSPESRRRRSCPGCRRTAGRRSRARACRSGTRG